MSRSKITNAIPKLILATIVEHGPITSKAVAEIIGRRKQTMHEHIRLLRSEKLIYAHSLESTDGAQAIRFMAGSCDDLVTRKNTMTDEEKLERMQRWSKQAYQRQKAKKEAAKANTDFDPILSVRAPAHISEERKTHNMEARKKEYAKKMADFEKSRLKAAKVSSIFRMGDTFSVK